MDEKIIWELYDEIDDILECIDEQKEDNNHVQTPETLTD